MEETKYYLAVDIGASSGRHILGCVENGKIKYEEVYRFENGPVKRNGHMCWEMDRLFNEIVNGMKACKGLGKIPVSMGIDTWGVDFVLLDKEDNIIGDTVCYRDERTAGIDSEVYKIIPEDKLYARTGIQKQIFNTIYQLMAIKEKEPENLAKAESFLMVPDYFNFLLTGVKKQEYTNATTGQLVDTNTKQWDRQLIKRLGLPAGIFKELSMPGTFVGRLLPEIQKRVGYDLDVILPGTHDTASAVLAVPMEKGDSVYISSGTWSLMGIERSEADCSERARECNFTNEGGYEGRFRFLKNIMGLWMIQS
ncbi:MAG: rhamnulokinase, partial [Lachnospiraceae bacterium]|nr:rhamnulokinase [Lachnospiraceae bacterium]